MDGRNQGTYCTFYTVCGLLTSNFYFLFASLWEYKLKGTSKLTELDVVVARPEIMLADPHSAATLINWVKYEHRGS